MPGPGLETFDEAEVDAVLAVLRERKLSRYRFDEGSTREAPSFTYRFERDLEALSGARHCLGLNSCTSALLAGMWALGIGPGDEVIVPGYTFVAPMAAVGYCGATIVLADIDDSLTLDPASVAARITPKTRAIVAVHMLGAPCDLDPLLELARRHGLVLIEDCAQAGGGAYRGRTLGTHGVFGAYSLNIFKTFTAGDGGVLLTNDEALYKRAFAIHDHGAAPFRLGVTDNDGLFGLNLRMHELTGAVAWAQLKKLSSNISRLRALKTLFRDSIGDLRGAAVPASVTDPEGDCATVLPYIFREVSTAVRVAAALGTHTLDRSGKHNYANIPQLAGPSVPRAIARGSDVPNVFRRGDLRKTDDILMRTVALSVGVSDSYLGTNFGISINSDPETVTRAATRFRSAVEA
jgi:dTDP-4-amino-4,6-dideoxygalactose transaminase